ncbi:hypothetical protein BJN45_08645 [Azonexus hydrophilus]|uniref:Uncharacterized protein n=1 Tax=Azonexus hydrophilus TaxID=418702 RepID=A0A1R1I8U3_9RHOO|nr:hypothetical protein [Azonexus hydrophilus]OMG55198.1 hypothetical protein BJN45_08645 [Azonexus hydrophilus]
MIAPRTLLSIDDMLRLPIGKFLSAYANLTGLLQAIEGTNGPVWLTPDSYSDVRQHTKALIDTCIDLGMNVTQSAALRVSYEIEHPEVDGVSGNIGFRGDALLRLKRFLQGTVHCFENEAEPKTALILPPDMAKYYDSSHPHFGELVQAQFPSAAYEIEEAAKCLAVSSDTAVAFHLMRTVELGIQAVSKCLGIPDPTKEAERNWGAILRKVKSAMAEFDSGTSKHWSNPAERDYFDSAYMTLDAVKNVWRNPTMHVDKKYNPDEAMSMFIAVRSFMTKLASRMDEQGLPKA